MTNEQNVNQAYIAGTVEKIFDSGKVLTLKVSTITSQNQKYPDYHDIKFFGDLISKTATVQEGDYVKCKGEMQSGSYTNRQGQKIYTYNLACRELVEHVSKAPQPSGGGVPLDMDDIPF